MPPQIVVYIDPENIPVQVVDYAESLARSLHMELLLYAVQGAPVMSDPGVYQPHPALVTPIPGHLKEVEESARSFHKKVKERYPKTRFEYNTGFAGTAIIHKVQELKEEENAHNPFLLVMPKSAKHSWWNEVIGTAETTVAADAPCPVLFVPEDYSFVNVSRILYLVDDECLKNYNYPGLKFLRSFSRELGAEITIAYMADDDSTADQGFDVSAAMEKMRNSIPGRGGHRFQFFPDHSAEHILQLAKLGRTDIIAFPFRETNIFERFFEHEVTRTLVLKSDVPALVF